MDQIERWITQELLSALAFYRLCANIALEKYGDSTGETYLRNNVFTTYGSTSLPFYNND